MSLRQPGQQSETLSQKKAKAENKNQETSARLFTVADKAPGTRLRAPQHTLGAPAGSQEAGGSRDPPGLGATQLGCSPCRQTRRLSQQRGPPTGLYLPPSSVYSAGLSRSATASVREAEDTQPRCSQDKGPPLASLRWGGHGPVARGSVREQPARPVCCRAAWLTGQTPPQRAAVGDTGSGRRSFREP